MCLSQRNLYIFISYVFVQNRTENKKKYNGSPKTFWLYLVQSKWPQSAIILVQNGNGQSEIVGVWLVEEETEDTMKDMVSLFKEQILNGTLSKL